MITLQNMTRRMMVFNLRHEAYCSDGDCACHQMPVALAAETKTGARAFRQATKRIPAVLTILAQGIAVVKDTALKVPEVAKAVADGKLRVVRKVVPKQKEVVREAASKPMPKRGRSR